MNHPLTPNMDLQTLCDILALAIFTPLTQKEIAHSFGITHNYVSQLCRRYGIYRYPRCAARPSRNIRPSPDYPCVSWFEVV